MEEEKKEGRGGGENEADGVVPALISVHPQEYSVAVAIGSELRVYSLRDNCMVVLQGVAGGLSHSDSIRAICFGANGTLFASGGDDKLVKVWSTDSWHCIQTTCAEKRVSSVALSSNGSFLTFADKFGVIWVVEVDVAEKTSSPITKVATPIFGHYCSIITSLEFSPDGQFIASADRDFKIRVSVFPGRPLKGVHEIQNFCLGHTDYISSLAFICASDGSCGFLLSGSGDSTVRLWDYENGLLLHTCEVGVKAGLVENEQSDLPAVIDLCASPNGSVIVAAIQRFCGILLLSCSFHDCSLVVSKVVEMQKSFIPTSLRISSVGHLWIIAGASEMCPSNAVSEPEDAKQMSNTGVCAFACIKVISLSDQQQATILGEAEVPGGTELLKGLQGKILDDADVATFALVAEAANRALHNLLIKRQYPAEKRELRKRNRNDKKQQH
ncbi:uncharacterized protein LOC116249314 [Nymphaea colorata]|nr:uncharacterized protein LOC116249314 [Nymphaea colorata]